MNTHTSGNCTRHRLAAVCTIVAALASGSVLADDDRGHRGRGDGHRWSHEHGHHHRHHDRRFRHGRHAYQPVERFYYAPPPVVVYHAPPPVVVERYVVTEPAYPVYPSYAAPAPAFGGGNRLLPAAVLGAAGGLLGSQVGHGDGRAAATAAGAVAGWVLGSNLGY